MNQELRHQWSLSPVGPSVDRRLGRGPSAVPSRRGGTILHPTDYTEGSRRAFALACDIARDRGSRLVVVHVAEPVSRPSLGMAPVPPLPRGYRGAWESQLRLTHPAVHGIRVDHRLVEGDVPNAILRVARSTSSDLIVMARGDRTNFQRLLTGSVTEAVKREAPCPVISLHTSVSEGAVGAVGRSSVGDATPPWQAILHPTDFSRPARRAFELARSLARASNSELIVVHIVEDAELYRHRRYRQAMEAVLRRMIRPYTRPQALWTLRAGDPVAEIVRTARQGRCNLVVMGSRRRTGLARLLARSVSNGVRGESPCAVLSVTEPPSWVHVDRLGVASSSAIDWDGERDDITAGLGRAVNRKEECHA